MNHRVVVTGLGLVTPLGNTVAATWAALLAGKSGAGPITKFDAGFFAGALRMRGQRFRSARLRREERGAQNGRVHTLRNRRLRRGTRRQRFEDYQRMPKMSALTSAAALATFGASSENIRSFCAEDREPSRLSSSSRCSPTWPLGRSRSETGRRGQTLRPRRHAPPEITPSAILSRSSSEATLSR